MTVENPTEDLARFAAGFTYEDLPSSARAFARNWFLDSVACALAGARGDETASFTAFARNIGAAGDATVIGSDERLSLLGASLANGYLITAVTVCDTYVPAHVHISPEIIPPALAVAERDGADGRTFLAAIALGAEIAVRVAAGIDYSVAGKLGWHMPGIVGPFGAAAAVGRLRGLDTLQMRNAFGLAGSQSAGTWASWGTPTVKFHQARGAASGLLAALLAEQGFKSSAEILAHKDGGTLAAYSNGGKPEAIIDGLGERFEFEKIALRLWPGGTPLQPALTAVFEVLARDRPDFSDIERVRISVSPDVLQAHARFDQPKGTFEALLSFHFTVAASLRDGRFWLDAVDPARLEDPDLRRFMQERIELVADPALTRERSAIDVIMKGGCVVSAQTDAAKGTADNPATLEDLRNKFEQCEGGRFAARSGEELLDLLVHIDEQPDLRRLLALLGSVGRTDAAAMRTSAA